MCSSSEISFSRFPGRPDYGPAFSRFSWSQFIIGKRRDRAIVGIPIVDSVAPAALTAATRRTRRRQQEGAAPTTTAGAAAATPGRTAQTGSAPGAPVMTIAGRNLVVSDGRGHIRSHHDAKGRPTAATTTLPSDATATTTVTAAANAASQEGANAGRANTASRSSAPGASGASIAASTAITRNDRVVLNGGRVDVIQH